MSRIGPYELEFLIGRGGCGEVWKAVDTRLGRVVAVKLLQGAGTEELARFRREAQLAARVAHPNIAGLYEFGDDPPYIAMEYVDGVPLAHASLQVRRRVEALAAAARAVQAAHEKGVLHRDLKPDNILVTKDGRAVVLDFGLARDLTPEATTVTRGGELLGTPAFMSPEQARGEPATARTDVYGLGATLFAGLAGRPPHAGPTLVDVLAKVRDEETPPPGRDRDLNAICHRALEKDSARRYATASEMADDVERWLRGEAVTARMPSMTEQMWRRVKREPVAWSLGALLVLIVVGAGAFVTAQTLSRNRALAASYEEALGRTAAEEAARRDAEARRTRSGAMEFVERGRARLEQGRAALYMHGATLAPVVQDADRAREHFEKALALDPTFASAHRWIGRAHALAGRHGEAVNAYRACIAIDGSPGEVWSDLGRSIIEAGFEEALASSDADKRVQLRRRAEEAGLAFAKAGAASAGIDGAIAEAYRLVAIEDYPALIALADGAEQRFGIVPGIEEFDFLAGMVQENLPRLTRALERRPAFPAALVMMASIAAQDPRRASAYAAEAIRIAPGWANAWYSRGLARMNAGELDGALSDYEEAIRLQPRFAAAICNRGVVKATRGNLRGAIPDFEAAIAISPELRTAHFNLGRARFDLRDFDGAEAAFTACLKVAPKHVPAMVMRAQVRGARGRFRESLEDLDAAAAVEPENAHVHHWRGVALMQLNRNGEALEALGRALKISADRYDTLAARGSLLAELRRYKEAVADLKRALELAPRNWPPRRDIEAIVRELDGQ